MGKKRGKRHCCLVYRISAAVTILVVAATAHLYSRNLYEQNAQLLSPSTVASNRQDGHGHNRTASDTSSNGVSGYTGPQLDEVREDGMVVAVSNRRTKESVSVRKGTRDEIWNVYECDDVLKTPRPIPDETFYERLYDVYVKVTGIRMPGIPVPFSGTGFNVPFYIDVHPTMGRGVYAKERIPNGTMIWQHTYSVPFVEGWHYRKFMMNVPDGMSCDVMPWFYIHKVDDAPHGAVAGVEVDPASMMNSADHISQVNMAIRMPDPNTLYAVRDINAGEQLLMVYSPDCGYMPGWAMLGL